MIYKQISDITYNSVRAVIINVGTRFVTTLSLLSTLKRTEISVLVVDCPYNNRRDDFDYFVKMSELYKFDLIQLPLRNHGDTLDFLFLNLNTDFILLIDSDLELLDNKIVDLMCKFVKHESVFGAGFRHGGFRIKKGVDYEEIRDGYYEERMWIPFTLLNTSKVKEALKEGFSFNIRTYYNIIPSKQKLSRKLLYSKKIRKIPFLRDSEYSIFNGLKKEYHGEKPLIVLYDTGSDIYMYLRYQKNYYYAGIDAETTLEDDYVKHYNGITRKLMYDDPYNTGSMDKEYENIVIRLKEEYSFEYINFCETHLFSKE